MGEEKAREGACKRDIKIYFNKLAQTKDRESG
jgi:hypothetical protein